MTTDAIVGIIVATAACLNVALNLAILFVAIHIGYSGSELKKKQADMHIKTLENAELLGEIFKAKHGK